MSGSESSSLPLPARPSIDDRDVWRIYWQQLGQPWRTEPEINEERQKDLAEPVGAIPPYKVSLNVEHLLRSMVRPYCPPRKKGAYTYEQHRNCKDRYEGLGIE